jgi:multidrug efflux pump subunit AcrA (membrane-fusion protein)
LARAPLEAVAPPSDIDSVDVRREIDSVLVREDSTASRSRELTKLVEFDETLSSIAGDVVDLQEALARLREESAEVERLLDERQVELAESELAHSRLVDECASAQEDRAEARAALDEAARQLEDMRTQVASLEHTLSQREAELAESELGRARLADDRAETQAALADAEKKLDAREAQVAALDTELRSLRIRVPTPQSDAATQQEASEPEPAFHLRLVPQSAGYALSQGAGPPPRAGERVEVDDKGFRVARVGRSPLPNDERPCAFLLLEAEQESPSARAPESMRG